MPTSRPAAPAENLLTEPLGSVLDRAPSSWRALVQAWREGDTGSRLIAAVEARQRAGARVYPDSPLRALEFTARASVRVVVLGQDPYPGPGQAEGLAFSVPEGVKAPPSLRNVFAELARDLGLPVPASGHLGGWARQGVLLLNTVLTVESDRPGSHARWGWEALTDSLVSATAGDAGSKVYMLWGAHAQAKATLIDVAGGGRHLVLQANHPSPLSARRPPVPFLGCGHFGKAQQHLARLGDTGPPLDWSA